MHRNTLIAANDNRRGTTKIAIALAGLIDLTAKAEAKRLSNGLAAGSFECEDPANLPHAPEKGRFK